MRKLLRRKHRIQVPRLDAHNDSTSKPQLARLHLGSERVARARGSRGMEALRDGEEEGEEKERVSAQSKERRKHWSIK